MRTRVVIALLLAAATVIVVAYFLSRRGTGERQDEVPADICAVADVRNAHPRQAKSHGASAKQGKAIGENKGGHDEKGTVQQQEQEGKDEGREEKDSSGDETERLVATFDSFTDKWMEPAKGGISMKDVDAFVEQFRKVPKDRKDECLHRALNLVPDENVMLLVGILMDKSQDKELVELVFNDVLNRDEGVKKPILQQIFKDREHPCWADTAWILDVTGEMPKKGKR